MTDARQLLLSIRRAARPVVLIDGGSGSGKTTLATALAPALGAQLVRLDDIYPGWDGLEAASGQVEQVLSAEPRWRRWDWKAQAPAEWHDLDPSLPVVVEGSGSLSRANRALATYGIWVELDEPTRKARALERDGELYAPFWDRWAAQERAFAARERPSERADLVLDDEDVAAIVNGLASLS
ncbi:ATP-binding protein [Lacisediminihabitans sp.]|uniref:ATP-binding protein n=1 Tax=Lacisediminihabitans sp. TaxID=2787631 RepID=UPI00374CAE45